MSAIEKASTSDVLRVRNRYVPEMYLKNWAPQGKVATYGLLVPNASIPLWKHHSLRGIGYHRHLYTYLGREGESDVFERWLSEKFESPSIRAMQKVLNGLKLNGEDWYHLVRFLAAQDVRTPARLHEFMHRHEQTLQQDINQIVQASIAKLEGLASKNRPLPKAQERLSITENPFDAEAELVAPANYAAVSASSITTTFPTVAP